MDSKGEERGIIDSETSRMRKGDRDRLRLSHAVVLEDVIQDLLRGEGASRAQGKRGQELFPHIGLRVHGERERGGIQEAQGDIWEREAPVGTKMIMVQ